MENKTMLVLEFTGEDGSKVTVKISDCNLEEATAEKIKTRTAAIVTAGVLVGDDGKPVTACSRAYFVVMTEQAVF